MTHFRPRLAVAVIAGTLIVGLSGCRSTASEDSLFPATIGQYRQVTDDKAFAAAKPSALTFNATDGKTYESAVTHHLLTELDTDAHAQVRRVQFYLSGNQKLFLVMEVQSPNAKAASIQQGAARTFGLNSAQAHKQIIDAGDAVITIIPGGWVLAGSNTSGETAPAHAYSAVLQSYLAK